MFDKEKIITIIDLTDQFHERKAPDWQSEICKSSIGIEKLHYEIYDYVSVKLIPSPTEKTLRELTIKKITSLIKQFNPSFKVKVFGSYAQNLDTKYSDIDLEILCDNDQNCIESEFQLLTDIYDYFRANNSFSPNDISLIPAKVPIIKAKLLETNINVDIGINNIEGIEIADIIFGHVSNEPILKYTILLIKELLRINQLNESINGGMTSLMLFEIVFYFFQETIKIKEKENEINLGSFFLSFLKFYSEEFKYQEYGITIFRGGKKYYKNMKYNMNYLNSNTLSVESCVNSNVDLGRNCTSYPDIMNLFKKIHEKLVCSPGNTASYLNEIGLL